MIPSLGCALGICGEAFLCYDEKLSTVFAFTFNLLLSFQELVVSETDVLTSKSMHPISVLVGKEKPIGENTQCLQLQIKNGPHFYSGKKKKKGGHVSLMALFHLIALSIFTVSFSLLN